MSALTVPFWFKQRQAKAEPAGENTFKLTGPNLPESYVSIRQGGNGLWAAAFRKSAAGPDDEATEPIFEKPWEAWDAAFEIYRRRVVT